MRSTLPALLACAIFGATAATTSTVVDIPAADGGTQRYLHVRPDAPIATIINIPGGPGIYAFDSAGTSSTRVGECDPVHRNRTAYAARGIALVFVDETSNGSVRNYDNVLQVVRHVRARDNAPIWIVGSSAGTAATMYAAATLPQEIPAGVIIFSPGAPTQSVVSSIRRPAQVVYHSGDPDQQGNAMFNALTSAPIRERSVLTGGSSTGCLGPHSMDGLDAEFVDRTAGFITRYNSATGGSALNVQGLWYRGEAESGWGVNIAHQGDTLFATWFTYDTDGSQMWLVAPDVRKGSGNDYAGQLFRTTGPPYNAPFSPSLIAVSNVGSVNFTFADASNGTFSYSVNGATASKPIVRQVFGPQPSCTASGAPGATPNFSDLWYNSPADSEAGWGINVTHQGDILFVTFFSYDEQGRGMWLVGPRMERTPGTDIFTGLLYRTTGPAFNAVPWNPAGVTPRAFASASLRFTHANQAQFSWAIPGTPTVEQVKTITRQVFGSPATVCR